MKHEVTTDKTKANLRFVNDFKPIEFENLPEPDPNEILVYKNRSEYTVETGDGVLLEMIKIAIEQQDTFFPQVSKIIKFLEKHYSKQVIVYYQQKVPKI